MVIGGAGVSVGGGATGSGVRDGNGFLLVPGGLSEMGVDGWLLFNLSFNLGLPSVGVGGTAGGGIAAESSAEEPAGGDIADEDPGKPVGGDMASGVATGRAEKYCVFSFCEADAGPVEVLEALLEIFNVSFFGASILSVRSRISSGFEKKVPTRGFGRSCALIKS